MKPASRGRDGVPTMYVEELSEAEKVSALQYHSAVSIAIDVGRGDGSSRVSRHEDGGRFRSVDAMIRYLIGRGDEEIQELL